MSSAHSSRRGNCTYKLSPRTDKAASKLCLKEKHNKRTLKRTTGPTLGTAEHQLFRALEIASQPFCSLVWWRGTMSRNQIIVMPDFFKACHFTSGNLKYFLPSVLSSYPFFIYSINSTGQELPLSEGLKHSEVSVTDAPLGLAHCFEKNYPSDNLTSICSYLIHNIHRL